MNTYPSEAQRLSVYQAIATRECRHLGDPARVVLSDSVVRKSDGLLCKGLAWWDGNGSWVAEIERGLPLDEEAKVVAHELWHLIHGDSPQIAPRYLRNLHQNIKSDAALAAHVEQVRAKDSLVEPLAELGAAVKVLEWRARGLVPWA